MHNEPTSHFKSLPLPRYPSPGDIVDDMLILG